MYNKYSNTINLQKFTAYAYNLLEDQSGDVRIE